MITEETVVVRYQTPNAPNEWLYQDTTDEGKPVRKFYRDMYLGKNQDPLPECTDEKKVQWEEEHKEVTLIADEGCWLTRVGFTPEQESAPEFWKEVRTSEPEDYTKVTDARRIEMEEAWHEAHPDPEPSESEPVAGATQPCG